MLGPQITWYDQLGYVQPRLGNRSANNAPRNTYRCADGTLGRGLDERADHRRAGDAPGRPAGADRRALVRLRRRPGRARRRARRRRGRVGRRAQPGRGRRGVRGGRGGGRTGLRRSRTSSPTRSTTRSAPSPRSTTRSWARCGCRTCCSGSRRRPARSGSPADRTAPTPTRCWPALGLTAERDRRAAARTECV